jgi:hypothetical protein
VVVLREKRDYTGAYEHALILKRLIPDFKYALKKFGLVGFGQW